MRKYILEEEKKMNGLNKEIISRELMDILVCPECKKDLELIEYQPDHHGLKCKKCFRIFPIEDGIPVMLIEEAIPSDKP